MQEKLTERKGVVDVLIRNAIVTKSDELPGHYRVVVPGAIREENIVEADTEEAAIEKVKKVLYVKEQSRLESLERLGAEPKGDVTIDPDNVKINLTKVER